MDWNTLKNWFTRQRHSTRTHAPRKGSRPPRYHLSLETLENRYTPSSISGHVYQDVTGNGLGSDDTPLAHVPVLLYRDLNQDGKLDRGDGAPVAVTFSRNDGSYSFAHLSGSTYFVKEVVPFDDVRTAPVLSSYYTVNLSPGDHVTSQDFDSYHKPEAGVLKHVYFLINGTTKVTDLRGNVHSGDTVQAFFTVRRGETAQVTLASYTAPGPTFDPNTASQQAEFDSQTDTFGPGTYSLKVTVPASYFQVDFVLGAAIDQLGPAGSNIFYSAQRRLVSADNGGTNSLSQTTSSLSGFAFLDNNNNGVYDVGVDQGIQGVTVTLSYTDSQGNTVTQTAVTNNLGAYSFTGLLPGSYTLTETPPSINGFTPETPQVGTVDGTPDGSTGLHQITGITLAAGQDGINYNFGEKGAGAGA